MQCYRPHFNKLNTIKYYDKSGLTDTHLHILDRMLCY